MSSIILVTGRVTADPVMQQGRTTGTEYMNLGLATNQRGNDGNDEAVFYQCYCNKFLADRLSKAGVKKGTCLLVYGELELRPFLYQKGERAGQPGIDAHITVKDWQFLPANRTDGNPAANGTANPTAGTTPPPAIPGNGSAYSGGPAIGANGAMPANQTMQNMMGQQMPQAQAGYPMTQGTPTNAAPVAGNYAGDGFTNIPESMPPQQLPFP
jgi:single-stranded DNA-binding protein